MLSEEDVESVSRLSLVASHNTGFSQGTSAMKVSGRLLNFEVDEYLIRHTVARGAKTELQAFCWRFELDGVVVVTEGDRADLEVLAAHFVAGFVLQEEVDTGKAKYEDILMRLEMAEEEDPLACAGRSYHEDHIASAL